ncbi:hypothetical protein HDU92_003767, partial [Lobulomyces angularis]
MVPEMFTKFKTYLNEKLEGENNKAGQINTRPIIKQNNNSLKTFQVNQISDGNNNDTGNINDNE